MSGVDKMPGMDGTGPLGLGPLTGRGLGPCGRGRALGRRGFGRRFGWGAMMAQPVELTKDQERKVLQEELKEIEREKKELEAALKKIK